MYTSSDIKNINFTNSLKGYKIEEVEAFLDKVEADYISFERIIKEYKTQIDDLKAKNYEYETSQYSIQTVLLNAQKLADQMVNEAKEKSEEIILRAEANINLITAKEKELVNSFEEKAAMRKANLQTELNDMIEKAETKAKSITIAAEDSVKKQQVIFDKLKLEISNFKSTVTEKYKEHLNKLHEIPDTVDMGPEKLAEIITAKIETKVEPDNFISSNSKPEQKPMEDISSGFSISEKL